MTAQTIKKKAIVWFRDDLRLADNQALTSACAYSEIIPLYINDTSENGPWNKGAAFNWWRHHSLESLSQSLKQKNTPLVIRSGDPETLILDFARKIGADAVFWNRRFEPQKISVDSNIKTALRESGIEAHSSANHLLLEPWQVKKDDQTPYRVYTPYWKKLLSMEAEISEPLPIPNFPKKSAHSYESEQLSDLNLLPSVNWDQEFYTHWRTGEESGLAKLQKFSSKTISQYNSQRDIPSVEATSKLSPHLAHGEITARQIWHQVKNQHGEISKLRSKEIEQYAKEIAWRDFAYHLLYHFPQTISTPLNQKFEKFPWAHNEKELLAWKKGQTGYPIVDAGMRELWRTGWMHNRVRMIVASFLVKHLRIHWIEGAKWFWDTLVDADLASNTMGWQWAAGCGADAAPYFRIFNPTLQGEKFDGKGVYTKHYVPELKSVDAKNLYQPWKLESPPSLYPKPVVTHTEARILALQAYEKIKG